jgi:ATP/maltotriose-dependent transcriptional regulator MalT/two-component SAPR family response regulator
MARNGTGKGRREAPVPALHSSGATTAGQAGAVVRARLLELTQDFPVTVVEAPGGSGKTTLLGEIAAACDGPVIRLTLDDRIQDAHSFGERLAAAASEIHPGFEVTIPAKASATAIADSLADACAAAGARAVLLDDLQHAPAGSELAAAVDRLVSSLSASCRVYLSGSLVALPGLAGLAVQQQLRRVGPHDLAFNTEEVVQLYRGLGIDLTLDDAQHLADITEGWGAALVLLADRVKQGKPAGSLEYLRSTDPLYEFVAAEQFDGLPEETRQFLLRSAVLLTLDAPTVNQLLGTRDAARVLESLVHSTVPAETVDDHPDAYRYGRVFRAFLVSRLRFTDPELFRELNLRAATINERALKWEAALYHVIQAGAWDRIVEIIEKVAPRMFEEGRFDSLAEWLEGVPDEALAEQPRLLLWRARSLYYLNQLDRALALISQAAEVFEVRGDPAGTAEAMIAKGMCLRMKGDYSETLDVLLKARSLLPADASPALTAELRKELGMTLIRCEALNEAIQELTAVVDHFEAEGDKYNIADAIGALARALAMAGRLAEAIVYLERARTLWEELGNTRFLVWTLNNLGTCYYLQGDLVKAESTFQQGLEGARGIDNIKEQVYLAACIADIKKDSGEYRPAIEMYTAALEDAWTVTDAYIRVYLMNAIADSHRLSGETSEAESWVSRARAEADKTGGDLEVGMSLVASALVKQAQDELKEAANELEEALPYFNNKGAQRELATAYFHLADAYFSLKKKTMALDTLESCAEVVKELGYDHFLVVLAQRSPMLVQYASANKAAQGYYARVVKLIKAASGSRDGTDAEEGEDISAAAVRAFGFGHTRVEFGGREITDLEWRSEKSKEMFFFFLANRRPLRKEEIVTALWPDAPEEKTTSAFHGNMYRLRAALYKGVIAKDSGRYVLDPGVRFAFDLEDYQQALQKADEVKGTPEAIPYLEKALALYTGQFAPDFYSEWAENLRWQMEEQQMSLLARLAAAYNEAGEYKRSADVCQKILDVDDLNEAAWYRLMANYVQSGQTEAAKYSFNRYVQILGKEDLDEEDIPSFDDLVREIKAGHLRV